MAHDRAVVASRHSSEHVHRLSGIEPALNRLPTSVSPVALDQQPPPGSRRQRELQACVSMLSSAGSGVTVPVEKRAHRRYPFRRALVVTPITNGTGRPDRAKSFPAFGIDISSSGVCFLGRQLVPARKAVLSVDGPDGEMVHVLFEPRWVRFTRGGWYQTGGRLLEVLPPDTEPAPNLRLLETPPDLDELCENSRHSHLKSL